MTVISNSSPLIALSRVGILFVFRDLFGKVYIPDTVWRETVLQSSCNVQKENILKAADDGFVIVETPTVNRSFRRTIDSGERGVLNLAFNKNADILIIDDKKARNEAMEIGFRVAKTSTLLRRAEKRRIISSYRKVLEELERFQIYLPN